MDSSFSDERYFKEGNDIIVILETLPLILDEIIKDLKNE